MKWLDGVFAKYPDLVIENCSSGGLRTDYAMLSRYSIQSTSDQEDYTNYATIAANACAGLTPEQAAVWSYPQRNGDEEEVVYNMINALLLRIHQSGHIPELSESRRELVREGIRFYKDIRQDIKAAMPSWPLGLCENMDKFLCSVLKTQEKAYLAVWRRGGEEDTFRIPLKYIWDGADTKEFKVMLAYPKEALAENCDYVYDGETGTLSVTLKQEIMARLFVIEK